MKVLGRLVGSVASSCIGVSPPPCACRFRPGMELQLRCGDSVRVGTAKVERISSNPTLLVFPMNLNALVPSVAEGDEIIEYEVPCTRCRCKRCAPGMSQP